MMNPLIPSTSSNITTPRKVAVIGAGVAGLVSSRELRREGHEVIVFERSDRVGGLWVYDPDVESDLLGLDPYRNIVHSSLYQSLRTNLPREIMGFRDYPFVAVKDDGKKQRDPRRYPGHKEMLNYLEDFTSEFQLTELIRFKSEVIHVGLLLADKEEEEEWKKKQWVVKSRSVGGADHVDEVFDAVVVCTGQNTEPRIAEIPGIDTWPGKQIHSHNYRVREPFHNQVVLLIGNAPSAWDISRDIVNIAKEVHVASRSFTNGTPTKQPGYETMWLHSMIESAHEDGTVVFQDGSSVSIDIILHCTGYKYYFPFLETNNIVTVDDNRVGPLYKHVFPPLLAPGLSFIGVPSRGITLPIFELQSKWVAGVLSGRISLPSKEEMIADVEAFYLKLDAAGVPKHYTHRLMDEKFDYIDWLVAECGSLPWEEWRKQMENYAFERVLTQPETYRDKWEDEHLILQAQENFRQYLPLELPEHAKEI